LLFVDLQELILTPHHDHRSIHRKYQQAVQAWKFYITKIIDALTETDRIMKEIDGIGVEW